MATNLALDDKLIEQGAGRGCAQDEEGGVNAVRFAGIHRPQEAAWSPEACGQDRVRPILSVQRGSQAMKVLVDTCVWSKVLRRKSPDENLTRVLEDLDRRRPGRAHRPHPPGTALGRSRPRPVPHAPKALSAPSKTSP